MIARPRERRALARDLRGLACIALTACFLALLAATVPATAAQLGEAEANEVRHVDERGGRWLDCHGPRKSDVCDPFRDFQIPR